MSYNVPVAVMIAALRKRYAELGSAVVEEWHRCDSDPAVVNALGLVQCMIEEFERLEPESVVEVPPIPPGTKLNDAPALSRELVVSLYRFDRPTFDAYELVAGAVEVA